MKKGILKKLNFFLFNLRILKKFYLFVFSATIIFLSSTQIIFAQTATPTLDPTSTISVTPTPTQSPTPTPTQAPTSGPTPTPTQGVSNEQINKLQDQIVQYEGKIAELQGQSKTLSSQIAIMDNQIKLTELRMSAIKQKIIDLQKDIEITKDKIVLLEKDINISTKALLKRIVAVYQVGKIDSWYVFLASNNVPDFFKRLSYLKLVQMNDKRTVYAAEQAKTNYANQKVILEEKEKEEENLKKKLEGYTAQLDNEKKAKQEILTLTKNDEKKYQDLLARAKAEFQAIQGIAAGYGNETEVASIKEGDKIATIISGASACSSGTHLHFEVHNNKAIVDPQPYLSSRDFDLDTCWLNYGCDSVNFSGSWQWPINGRPRITQGYGMTGYARWGAYGGGPHTGIDMVSDDLTVKAVKEGILFRGSIACGGGRLRYVKVKHNEGGIDSLYLHVNY